MTDEGRADDDMQAAIGHLASALAGGLQELAATGTTSIPRPQRPGAAPTAQRDESRQASANEPAPMVPPAGFEQLARKIRSKGEEARQGSDARADVNPLYQPGSLAETDDRIAALLAEDGAAADRLSRLQEEILGPCQRCKLHRGRTHVVFGVGDPHADLMFVGEGPGMDEDRQGEPFVGQAGQLLTKMIGAMGFARDEVYIANVLKCRPPNNRDPEADEVEACERFLKAQVAIVQPKVIVTLGRYASQCLLGSQLSMSRLRGGWQKYEGIDLLPTFHPAYLLRSPEKKREAWADLQDVMKRFGKSPPKTRG